MAALQVMIGMCPLSLLLARWASIDVLGLSVLLLLLEQSLRVSDLVSGTSEWRAGSIHFRAWRFHGSALGTAAG